MKTKIIATLLTSVLLLSTNVASAIPASSEPTKGANIAIAYKLPNSNQIYGDNQDIYYHPASTQKLITALSAILYLGPDYRLTTRLMVQQKAISDNKLILDENGILHSNVTVKFSGDPTLTSQKYTNLLHALAKLGVKGIDGKVILDISRFKGKSRGEGWSWDDLPVCFTAPSASIVINRNCTFASLVSEGPGSQATPIVPAGIPIEITSDVIAVKNKDYGGDCELEAQLYIDNKYHLTGCIPADNKGKPWPVSLAVADPVRWGIDWTQKILNKLNIVATGGVEASLSPTDDTVVISQIKSDKLSKLVEYMLQKSNNLYADTIAKNIASEYFNLPATYYRANRAMRSILRQYADIDLGSAYIVDGSGLSPHNLLTAQNLLDVLSYIQKHDDKLKIIEMLPVAGKSGTLHWRASVVNEPLKGRVHAKTGSLQNVANLAGFVTTKSGKMVPFVIFANSITFDERTRDRVKYRRMASPHYCYERFLLEQIYAEKIMGKDF